MTLRGVLSGLLVVAALALIVTLFVFRAIDRPVREAFERERAQVVFATPLEGELEGRYEDRLETLELQAGGRLVVTRTEYDDDLILASERAGRWSLADEVLTLTLENETEALRFGRVAGEPVLVASERVFRRVNVP